MYLIEGLEKFPSWSNKSSDEINKELIIYERFVKKICMVILM
jgi:hypothetical protein